MRRRPQTTGRVINSFPFSTQTRFHGVKRYPGGGRWMVLARTAIPDWAGEVGRRRSGDCSFASSALAFFRMGMSGSGSGSGSASFQSLRKSWSAASARTRAASASAPCEVLACKAWARAKPRCASAPVQQFQNDAAVIEDLLKLGSGSTTLPRRKVRLSLEVHGV
jgi:hypothetical protein